MKSENKKEQALFDELAIREFVAQGREEKFSGPAERNAQ
jgi:hypothetical protein